MIHSSLHSLSHAHRSRRIVGLAFLALLTIAPASVPVRAFAQQTAVHHHGEAYNNPAATETPRKEEHQEESFLNAPNVHTVARWLNLSEPTARVLFLAINFALIVLGIVLLLTKVIPVPKIIRERSQNLRQSLETAHAAAQEARQRISAVEDKLAGLDKEIAAFRAQVEQESQEEEKRIKASLKEESERIVSSAEQEIGAAAAQARRALRVFAADLAIEHAEKQLALTPETDRAVINEFIGHFEREVAVEGAGSGGKK